MSKFHNERDRDLAILQLDRAIAELNEFQQTAAAAELAKINQQIRTNYLKERRKQ